MVKINDENKKVKDPEEKATGIRSRRFAGMRNYGFENYDYTEDEDGNRVQTKKASWVSKEDWKAKIIADFENIDKMDYYDELYYLFHDRDIDENGQEKELHVHYVVRFRNPRSLDKTADNFDTELRNISKVNSESGALRYLTHTTEDAMRERKTRYNVSEITILTNKKLDMVEDAIVYEAPRHLYGEDKEKYYRVKISSARAQVKDTAFIKEAVNKICVLLASGDLDLRDVIDELEQVFRNDETADKELALRVWYDNKARFEESQRLHYEKIQRERKKQGRDLSTFYFSGGGGSFKSGLALKIANIYLDEVQKKNPNVVGVSDIHSVSNAGERKLDFLSGYNYEQVTLFDDLGSTAMKYHEFLNVFDPRIVSIYSSRFNNKAWFSDLALITRSQPIDDYIKELSAKETKGKTVTESINIKWQVARRFSLIFNIKYDDKERYIVELLKHKGSSTSYELDLIDTYKTKYKLKDMEKFQTDNTLDKVLTEIAVGAYAKFKLEEILINNKKPKEVYNYTDINIDEYIYQNQQFNLLKKKYQLLNIKSEKLYAYVKKNKIKKAVTVLKLEDIITLTNLVHRLQETMSAMSIKEIKTELKTLDKLVDKYETKYNKVSKGVDFIENI